MAVFNLNDIYRSAFHKDAPKPVLPQAMEKPEISSQGLPFSLTDDFGRDMFMPVTINEYVVPFAVINTTAKKTIISTPLPERGGAVMELISIDNYLFNIKGILVNDENVFPDREIIKLHKIFIINQSIRLRGAITDIFLHADNKSNDFIQAAIRQIRWPSIPGVENAQAFEMELESDMIFDLIDNTDSTINS